MKLFKAVVSTMLMAAAGSAHPLAAPIEDVKEAGLSPRQTSQQAGCADIHVVFARGTTEPPPLGIIAGPPFETALKAAARGKSVQFEGVNYPADIPGFLAGGDKQGSANMAQAVTNKAAACPNTKIVMSGYSQGGQLVHNAARQLSAAAVSRVSAAVIFGDPNDGKPVAQIDSSRTKVFCAAGDNICDGGILILPAHLSYGGDAGKAAQFVMSRT